MGRLDATLSMRCYRRRAASPCLIGMARTIAATLAVWQIAFAAQGEAMRLGLAANEFPYVAYVVSGDTPVRSGPGSDHYATLKLPPGYAVEVYRHDVGGWCAIRPPSESFSLVAMRHLQLIDEQLAEVIADGAVSRVGSALSTDRAAVQVLFNKGEIVELTEPAERGDAYASISPPAGEFRWIAARRLSRTPPIESSPAPPLDGGRWTSQSDRRLGGGDLIGPLSLDDREASQGLDPDFASATRDRSDRGGGSIAHLLPSDGRRAVWSADQMNDHSADEIHIVDGSPAAFRLAEHQQPAEPSAASPPVAPTAPVPQAE
ncbi:MAG: hypothetical protein AAF961_08915, partial [Planctomycetota bacterium]